MGHDNGHSNGNGNGGPWWAQLIARYGIVGALCVFLVYFLVSDLWANVQAMRVEHSELRYYLRGVCLNTATTETQRAYCTQEQRQPQ
jgi:hypothetical protein